MQAIEVKFLSCTNDDRLKAFCRAGSLIIGISEITDKLIKLKIPINEENRATYIAEKLIQKLGWFEDYYGNPVIGKLYNGNWVFVFSGKDNKNVVK